MFERLTRMLRPRLIRRRPRGRRVHFESLEDRRMLAIVVEVGHHFVKPDTPGESVEVSVVSTEAADSLVGGFNLKAEVGSSRSGPVFDGVKFGSLWSIFPHQENSSWDGNTAQGQVSFDDGLDAKANGSLVKLSLDTTGLHSGTFALKLVATAVGDSSFFAANGSIVSSVIDLGRLQILSSWLNEERPNDVNNDGVVSPLDALYLINQLNKTGSGPLVPVGEQERADQIQAPVDGLNLDVNGDGNVAPGDLLSIINCLNNGDCETDPVKIVSTARPADQRPGSDAATAITPPRGDEQTNEEILEPAEEPLDDPAVEEPAIPGEETTSQDLALEEFLHGFLLRGPVDELLA